MKKVNPKRMKLVREYMALREVFLKERPYCEWWMLENGYQLRDVVDGLVIDLAFNKKIKVPIATECHHRKGRGKFMLDTSTWMAVSSHGHKMIHAYPKISYERGYMEQRR